MALQALQDEMLENQLEREQRAVLMRGRRRLSLTGASTKIETYLDTVESELKRREADVSQCCYHCGPICVCREMIRAQPE